MELFLTFIVGIFIIIGSLVVLKTDNNDRLVSFSISLAFGVMLSLVIMELIPEAFELLMSEYSLFLSLGIIMLASFIGIFGLKILDYFVPEHEVEKETVKKQKEHFLHIGIVSSVALILHNLIEGMAIYSSATSDLSLGVMVSIGVGLHNIPLGMVIASTFYKSNNSKKKTMLTVGIISISTFFGGLLMHLFSSKILSDITLGILLSITLGMLIYIIFYELLPQIRKTKNLNDTILGVIIGIILLIISLFFG